MNKQLISLGICLCSFFFLGTAQELLKGDLNYYQFRDLYKTEYLQNKKYQRIDYLTKDRVFPSGEYSHWQEELKQQFKAINQTTEKNTLTPIWENIGPEIIYSSDGENIIGSGRVSFLKFDPLNTQKLFAGTPTGCVWLSEDKGQQWNIYSSNLPCLGYSDLVFDPNETQNRYLLTGDFDGRTAPFYGILKSVDNGGSWNLIDIPNVAFAEKIIPQESIPGKFYLITEITLLVSYDYCETWVPVDDIIGYPEDLVFHPTVDSIVYATSYFYEPFVGINESYLLLSENSGSSFSIIDTFDLGSSKLAVDDHNPDHLYILTTGLSLGGFNVETYIKGILKSENQGTNLTMLSGTDSLTMRSPSYNMIFQVSPYNPEIIIAGFIKLFISTDGGQHWAKFPDTANPYFHVDQHKITFDPDNNNDIYIANDGGIYKTSDFGETLTNLHNGLNITQVYEFANRPDCNDEILIGTQDNGSALWRDDQWRWVSCCDGFACQFDPLEPNIFYTSRQNQHISKTMDNGFSFQKISLNNAGNIFKTKFKVNPFDPNYIYWYSANNFFISPDKGGSWSAAFPAGFSNQIMDIAIAQSLEHIYVAQTNWQTLSTESYVRQLLLKKSSYNGSEWTEIIVTADTVASNELISESFSGAIEVHPTIPQNIWMTINKVNDHRIIFSNDDGDTWEDYSEGLPNAFINDLLYQPHSNSILYAATDFGVWYRTNNMDQWEPYNNGLPNTFITQLEISPLAEKLRCSTFESGIWEVDLFDVTLSPPMSIFSCETFNICLGDSIDWISESTFNPSSVQWFFDGGVPANSVTAQTTVRYNTSGIFSTTLISQNTNGTNQLTRSAIVEVESSDLNISMEVIDDFSVQLTSDGFQQYEWNTGETSNSIIVNQSGWYSLVASHVGICDAIDSIYVDLAPTILEEVDQEGCLVFPNPSTGYFKLGCQKGRPYGFQIHNTLGALVKSDFYTHEMMVQLPRGIYFLSIYDNKGQSVYLEKIIIF